MNYLKILGNFLVSFCTAWLGANLAGVSLDAMLFATTTALVTGIMALGMELKTEADNGDKKCPPIRSKAIIASLVV